MDTSHVTELKAILGSLQIKLPLGNWIEKGVEFLTNRFEIHFRSFSENLDKYVSSVIQFLMSTHPFMLIGMLLVLVYSIKRNWSNVILSGVGLCLIINLGYWQETLETVALVLFATLTCVLVGLPLGVLCSKYKWMYTAFRPLLDLMQTIPTFVYLIPTLMLFGLGLAPGVVSTVIFAMPAMIRQTYLGVSSTPKALLEVGDAFGANGWQRMIAVEIPYALPSILAGISQCVMLSLSMVVVAALVGANGLGKPVVQALNTVNVAKGFEAGLVIVIVAVFLDRLLVMRLSPTHTPAGE